MVSMRPRSTRLAADRLVEAQRIDDPVAGEGVDHQPLLVAEDDLLRVGVEIEHALVDSRRRSG